MDNELLDAAKILKSSAKQLEALDVMSEVIPYALCGDVDRISDWKNLKANVVEFIKSEADTALSTIQALTQADSNQQEIPFPTEKDMIETARQYQKGMQDIVDRDNSGIEKITIKVGDSDPVTVAEKKPDEPDEPDRLVSACCQSGLKAEGNRYICLECLEYCDVTTKP